MLGRRMLEESEGDSERQTDTPAGTQTEGSNALYYGALLRVGSPLAVAVVLIWLGQFGRTNLRLDSLG